jgi:hypothetical protein
VLFRQPEHLRKLKAAAGDFAWLLGRHYAPQAALTLVGNRYQLHLRQRRALARVVSAPSVAQVRRQRQVPLTALAGETLYVDTLNQIITIEVALAGGVVLRGHDGAWRDMASVHGTYRTMQETATALEAIGVVLASTRVCAVTFLIDAAVSNSGRLASRIRALAAAHEWPWQAELVPDADPVLQEAAGIVATSDSVVLDRVSRWCDVAGAVIQQAVPRVWCLDLATPPPRVEAGAVSAPASSLP